MISEKEKKQDNHWADVYPAFLKAKDTAVDFWTPIYQECEKHRDFALLGKQMNDMEARQWGLKYPKMPNLLSPYVNLEANKTLQTDYVGKINPNGGGATIEHARAREDVIRGLQRKNNISQVFNYARRDQISGGIAYSWSRMDYAGPRGFGKTLRDEYLEETFNVYPDPGVKSCTFSDSKYWCIKKEVPKADWKAETGQKPDGWGGKKKKELWYFFRLEGEDDTEYLMEEGRNKLESELPDVKDAQFGGKDLTGVKMGEDEEPLGRPVQNEHWHWYKIADQEIIDEEILLEAHSPIIACTGRRVVSKEKISYQPLTLFAEEPQIMYTIIENIINLRLTRSPYSKWKVAFESVIAKGMADLRKTSVTGDLDIFYKSFTTDGKPIPAPEEIEPYTIDAMLVQLQQIQLQKIEKIFGTPDASFGLKTNESSGIAIENREKLGDATNYDSVFNFMEYVKQVTRVKLDQIPKYLTAPQQMAFVDRDDNAVIQWINTDGGIQFDPDEEFELVIEASPMSQSARDEEANRLSQLAQKVPLIQQNAKIMAIVVKAQPGRYSQQISDILAGIDPQLDQAKQMIQQLQGHVQKLTQDAQGKITALTQQNGALKASLSIAKQSTALMRQEHSLRMTAAQANGQEAPAEDPRLQEAENQIKLLELQVSQYEAESGRMTAEANMLKAVGSLIPEPATPSPGEALP